MNIVATISYKAKLFILAVANIADKTLNDRKSRRQTEHSSVKVI